MEQSRKDTFQKMAEKFLNEKGKDDVFDLLDEGNEKSAVEYLLGAVDSHFEDGNLTFEEAARHYEFLGVSRERASTLRQNYQNKS